MPARILIIEDNPANLDLMVYLLQAYGHTAQVARDGERGLETALDEAHDLILCDVHMPGMDGYEVARRIRSVPLMRRTPLVAVTALAMVGDRERVLEAGFDGYLAKPINPETFVSQVEGFLPKRLHSKPRAAEAGSSVETTAPAQPSSKRPRVLIVDDAPANLYLLRSIFEPSGYIVFSSDNVDGALAIAREHRPDLILTDLHMPGRDGFDLVVAVKGDPQLRDIMVVIHSATVMSEKDREISLALGADAFLARPLEPQSLLTEVEARLNQRKERIPARNPDSQTKQRDSL